MKTITPEQLELLKAFFAHIYCFYHDRRFSDFDNAFWVNQLDSVGINWSIQNAIACEAENRQSAFVYFSSILKRNDIEIEA